MMCYQVVLQLVEDGVFVEVYGIVYIGDYVIVYGCYVEDDWYVFFQLL